MGHAPMVGELTHELARWKKLSESDDIIEAQALCQDLTSNFFDTPLPKADLHSRIEKFE
jgi:hypothetical protein